MCMYMRQDYLSVRRNRRSSSQHMLRLKKSTLNACWKAVWPDVAERANPPILLEQEYSQIIELAHSLGGEGFEDLSEADIIEIMADKEICEDDLIDMVNITSENESDNETVADGYAHNPFTAKVVREGLEQGRKLVNYFQQNDPHLDRALRFQRNMNECLNEYEELYNVLTKNKSQSLITNFISMSRRNEINPNRSTTETASNEYRAMKVKLYKPVKEEDLSLKVIVIAV
ncbi:tigger transposable element-derived protein 1 [Nephila pilipes]|uniref:Tigger transposable element-derived protein 1 n=1 Tax=Nephila pilipes TaxID=299642 RepID=A0A8X6NH98_NEPPI|nr:tigger transposable element-derived protein 1 [Nephila pilipes]